MTLTGKLYKRGKDVTDFKQATLYNVRTVGSDV